tara:strand:- start:4548 stop:5297 length:750 start_codon:yes stop_codon:yes gene_type:complete
MAQAQFVNPLAGLQTKTPVQDNSAIQQLMATGLFNKLKNKATIDAATTKAKAAAAAANRKTNIQYNIPFSATPEVVNATLQERSDGNKLSQSAGTKKQLADSGIGSKYPSGMSLEDATNNFKLPGGYIIPPANRGLDTTTTQSTNTNRPGDPSKGEASRVVGKNTVATKRKAGAIDSGFRPFGNALPGSNNGPTSASLGASPASKKALAEQDNTPIDGKAVQKTNKGTGKTGWYIRQPNGKYVETQAPS